MSIEFIFSRMLIVYIYIYIYLSVAMQTNCLNCHCIEILYSWVYTRNSLWRIQRNATLYIYKVCHSCVQCVRHWGYLRTPLCIEGFSCETLRAATFVARLGVSSTQAISISPCDRRLFDSWREGTGQAGGWVLVVKLNGKGTAGVQW